MGCTRPLKAYKAPGGGISFSSRQGFQDKHIELPCGQCISCRIAKARAWSTRCIHEAQLHEKNSFITLTYDEDNLPDDLSINLKDWQNFAKKLRKKMGPFRYYQCGEYGEQTLRPHFHALLFGIDFTEDRTVFKTDKQITTWVSQTLETTWGKGFCTIGELNAQTANYVSSYVIKKIGGKKAEKHYERIDPDTGEVWSVKPESATMSRRPGIGTGWFLQFQDDVYPDDFVVVRGQKTRPPPFYDQLLERKSPALLQKVQTKRRLAISKKQEDQTYEKRLIKDTIQKAKQKQKKRSL